MEEEAQLVPKLNQTSPKESIRPSLVKMERHWCDRSLCRAGMSISNLSLSLSHTHTHTQTITFICSDLSSPSANTQYKEPHEDAL